MTDAASNNEALTAQPENWMLTSSWMDDFTALKQLRKLKYEYHSKECNATKFNPLSSP
jgi:hypothetical protein